MDEAYADMVACDDGFRGELVGRGRHVDGVTTLHARPAGNYLSLRLDWQPHDDCKPLDGIGAGSLRQIATGSWHGECTEALGLWEVRGTVPGRLHLIERHRA